MTHPRQINVIDSHTAGEPTRLVIGGGPDLAVESLASQREQLRQQHDSFRAGIVREPRGSDVLVGALLCTPEDPICHFGVIFFNNVGYLGMCGHGLIGVVESLRYRGMIQPGEVLFETPVGVVASTLHEDRRVTIRNVESYRKAAQVSINVTGVGEVVGDVAWGGNWFFLANQPTFDFEKHSIADLQQIASRVRQTVNEQGFSEVDHVELFDNGGQYQSRNFVLCPGLEYDRSPCGTGTSAKIACLAADGKLAPGDTWVQHGILKTCFEGRYELSATGRVIPSITGRAYVTSESTLIHDSDDPFCWGIE